MAQLSTGNGLPDVVVTAVEMTTALATDADNTWKQLLDGQSGIRPLDDDFVDQFDLPVRIGGHLLEDLDQYLTRIELRRFLFLQKISTQVARRLWEQAGSPEVDTERLMVSIGTGLGATQEFIAFSDDFRARGPRAISPVGVQQAMPNAAAAAVGLERKAKAGILTPVSACASGAEAIALAWRNIVLGEADIAICGGVETKIEAVPMAAFANQGLLSTNNNDPAGACRPFDKNRDGFVFGEAGAMMLIEAEEHAKARGANIIGRVMGAGITSDGYQPVQAEPSGERAAQAMTRAIQLAGLTPGDIDHVNAHATGTVTGDLAEANAIKQALGAHVPAVYAPKAALGHSIGAVGAVEAILTVLALHDGVIPPTLNLTDPDPQIALDVVAREPRAGDYSYAVSNSFAFGGYNVALAFGKR
ncbi:KasA/KasB family beta-ketoacyl-ACP synthase [Mycobacterium sp.]|uniref:KasA/KasB family beta-ketoacyl-ACP synthase n=1 Tax=Mycobacterium sp. TaxID=1785 RepID=UPI0025DCAC72|nr:KasA/KasB family beta-ketoacyl-ACP synthase [Mycobacterium sp.]